MSNRMLLALAAVVSSVACSSAACSAALVTADFGHAAANVSFGLTGDGAVAQDATFDLIFTEGGRTGTATFAVSSFDDDADNDGTSGDFRSGVTTELRSNTLGVGGSSSDSIDPRGEALQITLNSTSNLSSLTLSAIDLASFDSDADATARLGMTDLESVSGDTLTTSNLVFGTPFAWSVGESLVLTNSFEDNPAGADDYALEALTFNGVVAVPEPTGGIAVAVLAIAGGGLRRRRSQRRRQIGGRSLL